MKEEEYEKIYKIKLPICPFCKTKMIPTIYIGYYDERTYWACECDNLKTIEEDRGCYA